MHLNEFAVGVVAALLIESRLRRTCTYNRICGLAEDRPNAARADDDGIGREGAHFHRAQIHGADAAAHALFVEHRREELAVLVLLDLAFGLIAPDLFVKSVKQLLAGGCSGKGGAVVQSSAEAAKVEQTFRRAVKRNAHAVEQVNDSGRGLAHVFDRRLVAEEIAAVNRVVEVLPGGIALALEILCGIDAALGADGVRALHRDDGKKINAAAHLRDLDHGGKSGQSAAYHNDFGSCHYCLPAFYDLTVSRGSGLKRLLGAGAKGGQAGQPRTRQHKEERQTQCQKPFLRFVARDNPPLRREQPDSIREVPRSRDQTHHIEQKEKRLKYFMLHLAERSPRIVVEIDSGKPHRPGVPHDVSEGDGPGPALRRVHPVASPRISDRISVSAIPDVKPVKGVKRNRQPDPKQFEEEHERKIGQEAHLALVGMRTTDRGRVRDQDVLEEERADRNDPGERVQAAQQEGIPFAGPQRSYALSYSGSSRTGC